MIKDALKMNHLKKEEINASKNIENMKNMRNLKEEKTIGGNIKNEKE